MGSLDKWRAGSGDSTKHNHDAWSLIEPQSDCVEILNLSKSELYEKFRLTLCRHTFYLPKVILSKVGDGVRRLCAGELEHAGLCGPGRGAEGRRMREDLQREGVGEIHQWPAGVRPADEVAGTG